MRTGKRKQPEAADSKLELCATPRRSARLKLVNSDSSPDTKRSKNESTSSANQDAQIPTVVGPEVIMEEAAKKRKSKKKKKVIKDSQKETEKQLESKPEHKIAVHSAESGTDYNADRNVGNLAGESRLLVDKKKAEEEASKQLQPFLVQRLDKGRTIQEEAEKSTRMTQIYESPRKAENNMGNLQGCNKAASPRKSAKQQYYSASETCHIQAVKSALHLSAVPDNMLCREAEQSKVFDFCKECILQQQPGSLYICGCPGTGKSLVMEKVKFLAGKWAEEGGVPAPEILSLNCTSLTNSSDIFQRVLLQLFPKQESRSVQSCKLSMLKEVKHALCKTGEPRNRLTRRMLLLIVDEMDYLITKDQSVLYELFGLAARADSRCILIGVANAIDLADRFLPKLQSLGCKPTVITFPAYTKDQVLTVLSQRLKVLPFTVFHSAALELCARKVAAASGDMRKALHVCRSAVELLELEMKTGLGGEMGDLSAHNLKTKLQLSPSKLQLSPSKRTGQRGQGKNELYTVQIHHMAQALAKTFRSAVVDTVKSLPKHQQMVLCSAVRLFRQRKKDATLGQLNTGYVEFCKSTDMHALSVPEFSSICRVLADQGLLNIGSSREDRLRRVTLQVDEGDIVFALQGMRFFRNNLI